MKKNISDHNPIRLTISGTPIKIPCKLTENIARADWPKYKNYIQNTLAPFNNNKQRIGIIDSAIRTLTNVTREAKALAIPITKFKVNHRVPMSIKFFRLQKVLIALHNLLETFRNNPAARLYIINHRNNIIPQLKQEARLQQAKNWNDIIQKINQNRTSNPNKFWNKILLITGKSTSIKYSVTDSKSPHGNILKTPQEIENSFREECRIKYSHPPLDKIDPIAFQNVTDFHLRHPDISTPWPTIDITRAQPDSITTRPISYQEVRTVINRAKNKAPGPDEIRKIHLLNAPKIFIVMLTKIFNYALTAGYYPKPFKKGTMIFIPKPGKDLSHPANYRPITLINLFGKLYGKILNNRLVAHMEQGNWFDPLQYGFRRGRGTESSLALSYEFIAKHKGLDKARVSAVSRDISGAFDRVWHNNLIMLFTKIGLPDLFIKVLSGFLKDRELKIKIYSFLGPSFGMEGGVPQGAPDSPDIFNISTLLLGYLMDTPHTYSPWYCDDQLQIIATPYKSKFTHKYFLKKAIAAQNGFERTRGIITCDEKSIITPIGMVLPRNIEVTGDGITHNYPILQSTGTTKILGLKVNRFSFTASHIDTCVAKGKEFLSKIHSLQGLDCRAKMQLVQALVISSLTYPATPLNTASLYGILKLQRVLNKALKFVFNAFWPNIITSRALHIRAKIKPINQILHNRANKIWSKIEDGTAGDINSFNSIKNLPFPRPHHNFPSSYLRAQKDEPPPIYTRNDCYSAEAIAYYNS